ncbi:MAG: metal ABC transporter permease [Bdellovibrionales bacterium]|nr:metal ABC transporter permease [Bdellovibrionales bacterium]
MDLMHFLFGHLLAVDPSALFVIGGVACFTLVILFLILKALLLQVSDPTWAQFRNIPIRQVEFIFLFLVVLNLVAAFQVLGTLMAVGLMILPGVSARLWSHSIQELIGISIVIALIGCFDC